MRVEVVALATSVTLTVAPGITAPLESVTLPVIFPRNSWACAIAGTSKHIAASAKPAISCNFFVVSFIFCRPLILVLLAVAYAIVNSGKRQRKTFTFYECFFTTYWKNQPIIVSDYQKSIVVFTSPRL